MSTALPLDSELMRTVSALLKSRDFRVSRYQVADSGYMLVAESPLFVIGILATATVDDLVSLSATATTALLSLAEDRGLGAKQWDIYLVLLAMEDVPDGSDYNKALTRINYDTQGVRKIARWGIGPDLAGITDALRMFLPLPSGEEIAAATDPLDRMRDELVERGFPSDQARRLVDVFRSTKTLEHA